jgi:hypothetical protein
LSDHHENPDPNPKRKPRRIAVRLSRNLILHYRKSAKRRNASERHHKGYGYRFYEKTKEEAWKRPIEAIGVVIVAFYTAFAGYQSCKMRDANRFSQQIVRSTISASVTCAASKSFAHRGSREEPLTGAFYVSCQNAGKVPAENVSGIFKVTAKTFPEEKELWSDSWPFGGSNKVIGGNDGDAWPFHTPKYSPETEPQLITDGKEVIVGEIVVSFVDETGQKVTREFCSAEMNSANLGGSPNGWASCQMMDTEKAMLTNPRRK